jgi:predicted alpha/beta hydrolase family esterase
MSELKDLKIYACSIPLPSPDTPICSEWIEEISRHVKSAAGDEIYLVGHSLGVAAILNYAQLELVKKKIEGVILVSGRYENNTNPKTESFYKPLDFKKIKRIIKQFSVFHADNDDVVPFSNGIKMSQALGVELITIKDGGHLNRASGFKTFPRVLESLKKMLIAN